MKQPALTAVTIIGILVVGSMFYLSVKPPAIDIAPSGQMVDRDAKLLPDMMDAMLPVLADERPAFQGITDWWNTPDNQPLTDADLEGKVVMIKFWTYSCINCIRTYPFIKRWVELYEDDGFVLIGVHTPEFEFESKPENVAREIEKNGFTFPVALDPDYKTWRAYNNRFWPAEYLFDKQGRLRYTHFGEGKYDETEEAIKALLMEGGGTVDDDTAEMPEEDVDFSMIKTRETYFGYNRAEAFVNAPDARIEVNADYELQNVQANEWSVGGAWRIEDERSIAFPGAIHRFNVQAPIYNIVLDAPEGTTAHIRVMVDGKPLDDAMLTDDTVRGENGQAMIEVSDPRLYRITNIPDAGRHTVEIEVLDGEVRFYAATFG